MECLSVYEHYWFCFVRNWRTSLLKWLWHKITQLKWIWRKINSQKRLLLVVRAEDLFTELKHVVIFCLGCFAKHPIQVDCFTHESLSKVWGSKLPFKVKIIITGVNLCQCHGLAKFKSYRKHFTYHLPIYGRRGENIWWVYCSRSWLLNLNSLV